MGRGPPGSRLRLLRQEHPDGEEVGGSMGHIHRAFALLRNTAVQVYEKRGESCDRGVAIADGGSATAWLLPHRRKPKDPQEESRRMGHLDGSFRSLCGVERGTPTRAQTPPRDPR